LEFGEPRSKNVERGKRAINAPSEQLAAPGTCARTISQTGIHMDRQDRQDKKPEQETLNVLLGFSDEQKGLYSGSAKAQNRELISSTETDP
jgi:hypothetical protein